MNMSTIVGAVVGITVSIIVIATVLAPQLSTYTATGGALEEYKGLLGAVVIMMIVAVLMVAVRLVTGKRD
jgi:hypothetical protein